MKVFQGKDGRILQLADKEKISNWSPEMPLIFIGNVREKRIPEYKKLFSKSIVQEIETYLHEILEEVAIPKLINALQSDDSELRSQVAQNFVQISESNADLIKIALPHIETALAQESSKPIKKLLESTLNNYKKAQKRKLTAKKRAKLRKLTQTMAAFDRDYADGKISDAEYLEQRKTFVVLQREIELEEAID